MLSLLWNANLFYLNQSPTVEILSISQRKIYLIEGLKKKILVIVGQWLDLAWGRYGKWSRDVIHNRITDLCSATSNRYENLDWCTIDNILLFQKILSWRQNNCKQSHSAVNRNPHETKTALRYIQFYSSKTVICLMYILTVIYILMQVLFSQAFLANK